MPQNDPLGCAHNTAGGNYFAVKRAAAAFPLSVKGLTRRFTLALVLVSAVHQKMSRSIYTGPDPAVPLQCYILKLHGGCDVLKPVDWLHWCKETGPGYVSKVPELLK